MSDTKPLIHKIRDGAKKFFWPEGWAVSIKILNLVSILIWIAAIPLSVWQFKLLFDSRKDGCVPTFQCDNGRYLSGPPENPSGECQYYTKKENQITLTTDKDGKDGCYVPKLSDKELELKNKTREYFGLQPYTKKDGDNFKVENNYKLDTIYNTVNVIFSIFCTVLGVVALGINILILFTTLTHKPF